MKYFILISLFSLGCQSTPPQRLESKSKPLVIAHRGASGHLPEHTLEAYQLAIQSYADFVEPDLVSTKDGILIVRHENELSDTTDVAKKFPKRKTTKTIDGVKITGWFSEDFTIKEIKTLRAFQRFDFRDQDYNGKFGIPTFEEVLKMIAGKKTPDNKQVGIYPEIKHGKYFRSLGLPLEEKALALLNQYGFVSKTDPAIIQSFEPESLMFLRSKTQLRLVQLLGSDAVSLDTLERITQFADGIGPNKILILPENPDGTLGTPTNLVKMAHGLKLFVHPYTFRSDRNFLNPVYQEDPQREYQRFFELGVDGVFTDFPEDAAKAKELLARP
jgi:glycerophosphoryl diester phosphodiesterase